MHGNPATVPRGHGKLHLEHDEQLLVRGKWRRPRQCRPTSTAHQRVGMLKAALNHLASTGEPCIESCSFATLEFKSMETNEQLGSSVRGSRFAFETADCIIAKNMRPS